MANATLSPLPGLSGRLSPVGGLRGSIVRQDAEHHGTYSGPLAFDPSDEAQTIETANLVVPGDIVLGAIPAYRPDVRDTTAVAADVAAGRVFYGANGSRLTGSQQVITPSYTLLATKEIAYSTTATTAESAGSLSVASGAWTSGSMIYVRVRDKAGKRAGYWYGSDAFFQNIYPANGVTTSKLSNRAVFTYALKSPDETFAFNVVGGNGNASYGVYAQSITLGDRTSGQCTIELYGRYSSSYGTISGTYVVEVYALNWPGGISPFAA